MKMRIIMSISLMSLCFCVIGNCQEVVSETVFVSKEESLKETDCKIYTATKLILFESGFCTKPGSNFRAEIVEAKNDKSKTEIKSVLVYPNPGSGLITVQGFFQESVLGVFDATGNLINSIPLNGTNPAVDISAMKKGDYYFKISNSVTRFIKN